MVIEGTAIGALLAIVIAFLKHLANKEKREKDKDDDDVEDEDCDVNGDR